MSTVSLEHLQQDGLTMSVARALALANEAAVAHSTKPAESLVPSRRSRRPLVGCGVSNTVRGITSAAAGAT